MKILRARDLLLVASLALAMGAVLAAIGPGEFVPGWAGFTVILLLGGVGLVAAVRWGNGGRRLAWMSALALSLRLLAGTALYLLLPVDGYDEPDDRAGYVFTDAHRRDDQAWEMASSEASLSSAFGRMYYSDQYGGLLAFSALVYRSFSPDMHRPLLVLAIAAIAAALGVPFFFRATSGLWSEKIGALATWLYCLYPESVLTGGAQMREPFLLTFISVSLWGFSAWIQHRSRGSIGWLAVGLGGTILFSPPVGILLIVLLGVLLWVRGDHVRTPRALWAAGGMVLIAAFLFLVWSLGARSQGDASPMGIVTGWFRDAVAWVVYQLERGSGQVQNVFSKLFPAAQFVFVVAYGVTQPLLPPAFLEPTTATWHAIGIARSLGWYVMLPLLVYAPIALRRAAAGAERRTWAWLTAFSWGWILLSAIRAGGDQWDNPRYRLIFFGIQAVVAALAWAAWRGHREAWLPRILAAEILCLLLFTQWYLARYYLIGIHLPIMVVMTLSIVGVILILGGGALWDRRRGRPNA